MSLAVDLTNRLSTMVESRTSRRGFINRTAMAGTALAVSTNYVLRPTTAYAAICSCPKRSTAIQQECNCNDLCCDGYTEFCCQIYGTNSCPTDTVLAGWWKVDNSSFCDGAARYYMDCNMVNPPCDCGPAGACRVNNTCSCRSCGNRADGCTVFRYGNCNNDITCVGPIMCRVVTCSKPWEIEPGCSDVARTDANTAGHHRPCLDAPVDPSSEAIAWTKAIYKDFMNREPGSAEQLEYATRATNGEPRSQISVDLSRTETYIGSYLGDLYWSVFNRRIDDNGRSYWTQVVLSGFTLAQVGAQLYASDEFYNAAGSDRRFVERLYSEILGRQGDTAGIDYWTAQTGATNDRSEITTGFYNSLESRRRRVAILYQRFLNRSPDPSGHQFWADVLASADDLALATFLAGSDEYYELAQGRFAT